jgi:Raf kinase inhibitor-like YbhB/YbcL family protein
MKTILFIIVIAIIIGSFIFALNNSRDIADTDKNNNIINNQNTLMDTLKLTSASFEHNSKIPSRHTCDGEGISPAFEINGVDENAKSLVLIMDDPDAPSGVWDHWVKFDIATSTTQIEEGVEPGGVSGVGTSGNKNYFGPCPPDREHRYFFKLYSLDTMLELKEGVTKKEVEKTMEGHILQSAELVGLYERNND